MIKEIIIEQLGKEMKILAKDIEIEIRKVDIPRFNKVTNRLGNLTLRKIRNNIKIRKKRPQSGQPAKLENAIDITFFPTGGWGIGEIERLNREAPHWYFINFGVSIKGMIIPGRGKLVTPGIFQPGVAVPTSSAFRNGRWISRRHLLQGKMYAFAAKRGIEPMNYISRTAQWLNNTVDKLVKE